MVAVWLILAGVLVLIEFATVPLTSIWFACGALAAMASAVFHAPVWLQVGIFVGVSAFFLFVTRPLALRLQRRDGTVRTNADSLIGQEAVVTERIDNLQSTGAVQVNGQEWTARSVNPEHTIEKGEVVMIRGIEGVKLMVGRRLQEDGADSKEESSAGSKEGSVTGSRDGSSADSREGSSAVLRYGGLLWEEL